MCEAGYNIRIVHELSGLKNVKTFTATDIVYPIIILTM